MLFFKSQSLLGRIVNHTMFFSLRDFLSLLWFQTNFIVFARLALARSSASRSIACARVVQIFSFYGRTLIQCLVRFHWIIVSRVWFVDELSIDPLLCVWKSIGWAILSLSCWRVSKTRAKLALIHLINSRNTFLSSLWLICFCLALNPSNPWYITNDLLTH